MKKIVAALLIIAITLCTIQLPIQVLAANENSLTFVLNSDGLGYSVIDCSTSVSGSLVIPSTYNGKPVTAIGDEAISWCTRLTSVTIPDSVTSIGKSAFEHCDNLTSVTIGNSVTSVGSKAFQYCKNVSKVNISDIAAWCRISFAGLSSNPVYYAHSLYLDGKLVSNLAIPNGVTSIGDYAFCWCHSLTSVSIPDSVTDIGSSAFNYCINLTSANIPKDVTNISDDTFHGCHSLTSITIPDGVISIGRYAFSECQAVTNVTIPNSVTSIGEHAFSSCWNLTNVTLSDNITRISGWTFSDCNRLKSVSISDGVTSIGKCAFYDCRSMPNITIPDSVTSIDYQAFRYCTGLTDVYYEGSEEEWACINIDKSNSELTNTTIHYGSDLGATESKPNSVKEYNGHRYQLIAEEMNWIEADEYCRSIGGHLVTISTAEENSFVQSLINKSTMIGLSDAAEEGAWSWVTGESLTYTNWAKNEPNNQSNEDYVLMQVKGTWNDGHLDREKWPFICEWDDEAQPSEPVEIPEAVDNLSTFNTYFVTNYYDNLNAMYQYDSVATDILSNSSSFQINWNSCLSALSNKEFLDVLKFENHPEYYYQTVLFESIMQTKLNDDYWSALTSQIGQSSLDAISYYVKYDANFTSYEKILKQKLNTTMTDFSIDSVQYKRLSDYYGQYCNQLKTYDTVKDIYDLTVKADGTVEDFFNALSNYACIYNTTEEIISALEYLKLHLEASTSEEDQYILTAVNNILASLDRTLNEQLVLNCLGTAKDLLWGVFWAAISDAFPGALALDIASFTIDSGLALSNVFFPTTISADSYCKLYADYAIEVVTREAFKKAYTGYSTNPSDELATITVGLYDLLGYTYAHEIEVAAVLSEQLHKDGLINGLKNLFSSKNISTYKYEQDCIKAYEAYLNEIASVKVEAQTTYGLAIGTMQPVVTVYFVNGKVAALNEVAINTGDIYHVSSGEFPLPDFVGLRIAIEGYYLDQQFNNPYEEAAINKPLSLYCNLLLTKVSDGTPVLFDHSTGISVSSKESMPKHTLSTSAVTSGNIYTSVERHFADSEFELYDISLLENGVQVQPSGEVIVEIPVNSDYANRKAKVYHVTANGEFEDMNATRGDGVLQFTTTHFSCFVVVYENTGSTWLIPLIIAVVMCGAGVSLFFILKSRKKRSAC